MAILFIDIEQKLQVSISKISQLLLKRYFKGGCFLIRTYSVDRIIQLLSHNPLKYT